MKIWFCTFMGEFQMLCSVCVTAAEMEYDEDDFTADAESHKLISKCDSCGVVG